MGDGSKIFLELIISQVVLVVKNPAASAGDIREIAKYAKLVLDMRELRAPDGAEGAIRFESSDQTKLPLLRQLFSFEL